MFEESDLAKAAEHCQLAVNLDEKWADANPGEKGFLDYAPPRPGRPRADTEG